MERDTAREEVLERDLEELHQWYLGLLIIIGGVIAWIAAMRFLSHNRDWERTWPVVCLVLFGVLTGVLLRQRHFSAAAALIALSLASALLLEVRLVGWELLLALLPALVVLVTAVSMPLALAITAYGLLGLFLLSEGQALPVSAVRMTTLSLVFVPLSALAAARRFHTAFTWARVAAHRAEKAAIDAQSRRAEAMKAMTATRNAYYLLERTNHALAQAQAELEEARRLKTEFVNTVSHELRAPLNYIVGFSELMVNSPEVYGHMPWPPGLRQDLEEIYKSSSHLSRLIDDILDLAQIESQRILLSREQVNLGEIAREAADMVRPWAERKGLLLRDSYDHALPPLYLDPTRMRQVVLNLLNNAIRFTERGEIVLAVARQGDQVVLSVSDTGPGIPLQQQSLIFQEFVQLDSGDGRPIGGSGLGLAICRKFVEIHGGRIEVESKVGLGSTFRIIFSLDTPFPTTSFTETNALDPNYWRTLQKQGLGRDILLALGDASLSRHLQAEMERYEVLTTQPAELPSIIEEVRPRAIVVGEEQALREALAAVARSPHDVPVVSLPQLQIEQPHLPGASMHLTKPVTRTKLLDAVAKVAPAARTVLTIDDDPQMRRFLRMALESAPMHYRVLEAGTPEEGWQILHTEPVQLVLLDLWLPERIGFDFLEEMRGNDAFRHIQVITISAYISPSEEMPPQPQAITIHRKGWLRREQVLSLLRVALEEIGPRFRWEEPVVTPQSDDGASPVCE